MTNFDEFKQKAKDTMETIADKSVELYKIAEEKTRLFAKITKLSTEVTFEKGDLRKHYRELGQRYYELHKDAPESELAQSCVEITKSLEFISSKQKEIDALRGFADFEPAADSASADDDMSDDACEAEIIVEDSEDAAPGNTADAIRSVQDTDTLEEPEGDVGIGSTPPTFRL
jgi:hypothetical protein